MVSLSAQLQEVSLHKFVFYIKKLKECWKEWIFISMVIYILEKHRVISDFLYIDNE